MRVLVKSSRMSAFLKNELSPALLKGIIYPPFPNH